MSTYAKAIERPKLRGNAGVSPISPSAASARPLIAQLEQDAARTQAEFDAARRNALAIFQDEQSIQIRHTLTDIATRNPDDPAALRGSAEAALGPIISGAKEASPVIAANLANSADAKLNELVAAAGVAQAKRVKDEARAAFLSVEQDYSLSAMNSARGLTDADPRIRSASAMNLLQSYRDYSEALARSGYSRESMQKKENAFREKALTAAFIGAVDSAATMSDRIKMLDALDAGTLTISVETPNGRADFPIGAAIPPEQVATVRAHAAKRAGEALRLQTKAEKDARRARKEAHAENATLLFAALAEDVQPGAGEARVSPEAQTRRVLQMFARGEIGAKDTQRAIAMIASEPLRADVPESAAHLWTELNGGTLTAEAVMHEYTGQRITPETFGFFMRALKTDASAEARTEWQALSKTIAPPSAFNFRTAEQNAKLSEIRREWNDALDAATLGKTKERPRDIALRIQEREKARSSLRLSGSFMNIGGSVDWIVRDASGEPDIVKTAEKLKADKATLPREVWNARAAYVQGELQSLFPAKAKPEAVK